MTDGAIAAFGYDGTFALNARVARGGNIHEGDCVELVDMEDCRAS